MNDFHEANRIRWNAGVAAWARGADSRQIWNHCHRDPTLALRPSELHWLGDVRDKKVAVLGSGDNQVVFALAGLGAHVTSVDISEKQLEIARGRAATLGLDVRFVRADVTELSAIPTDTFDMAYTGGHVAVWVSDLRRFYAEAARVIRPGGRLVVSEYHPFRNGWHDNPKSLQREWGYFDRGPHAYENAAEGLFDKSAGKLTQYETYWTVADYYHAVNAVCDIEHLEEFGDAAEDWESAPLAGLPATLLIVGKRR
jgi:ubiquinone/menaquinone biosynthesis C-methylase UbiE